MFSSRLNLRLAHLDEAGDVCGVVAGVGVLVPVHGVHGLTAAPTLATAWLEAAAPATTRHRPRRAWDRRHQPDTVITTRDGFMRGGEGQNKSQIVLNYPNLQYDFDFMYDEHFTTIKLSTLSVSCPHCLIYF